MHPWIHLGGDVALPAYAVCIVVGLLFALGVVREEARREGLPLRAVMDAALVVVPAGAIGARAWILLDDPTFFHDLWGLLRDGGWGFQGSVIGVTGALVLVSWWRGLDPWRVMDVFGTAMPLGLAFGRMGCLAAGCCHGRPADWPLGFEVPWSVRYAQLGHVPEELLLVPLHPAPLYEAIAALGLFVMVRRLRRGQAYAGQAFLAVVGFHGLIRVVLELFRGDLERGFYLGDTVSTAQLTGLAAIACAVAFDRVRRRAACTPS